MNPKTLSLALVLSSLCIISCAQKPKSKAIASKTTTHQPATAPAQKTASTSSSQKAAAPISNSANTKAASAAKTTQQLPVSKPKPAVTEERTTTERKIVEIVPIAAPDSELKEP